MSISHAETPCSPESTYVPGGSPTANRLARQLFLISVGTSAVPVLVAAGIMLQNGHGLPSKTTRKTSARSIVPPAAKPNATSGSIPNADAPRGTFAVNDTAPHPAPISSSALPVKEDSPAMQSHDSAPGTELSQIRPQPFANSADVVGRLQTLQSGSDILQRDALLSLALVPIPATSAIHEADAVAAGERSAEPSATATTASQAKKIRAEIKPRTVAHHRYRPQTHAPPSLLAKIGQSVKKGLINVAKFPRQAMERRSWD